MAAQSMMRSARLAVAEIATGQLSSEALVQECLDRIDEREHVVRAWTHVDRQGALQHAHALDKLPAMGCLHGLPVAWKDIIDCQGLPSTCGSPIYANHHAAIDAGAVAMSRRAGALVLGKTVTAEFATSHPGPTTNPHNSAHTPGGSSSGSAAAVADGMVPLAMGTQTGGSVIRPASFCGIVGFKPSFGLINRQGVKQVSDSFDTLGTFARSVEDTALLVAGVTGRSDFLNIRAETPQRVVMFKGADWAEASTDTQNSLQTTLQRLSLKGVHVSELELPLEFEGMPKAHHAIEYFELARALQHEYRCHSEHLSDAIVSRIEWGLACEPAIYEEALALRAKCQRLMSASFNSATDLLLTPSAPGEAPQGLDSTGKAIFNRLWTALGLPCITLPGFLGSQGLPIGVQFVAGARQDARLLSHAIWLEQNIMKCE